MASRVKDIVTARTGRHRALSHLRRERRLLRPRPAARGLQARTTPRDNAGHYPAGFDHLGFRVPFVAISPYAKHHYVSHHTYDHTSILKFIETKFNIPALTGRDANADGLLDLFDFNHPVMAKPDLPKPSYDWDKAFKCIIPPGFRGL